MAGTIALELLTPQKLAVEIQVNEATLPGMLGEFTVLPGHAPYVAQLKPGVLRFANDGGSSAYVVGRGFAEVVNDRLLVLTRSVEGKEALDAAQLRQDLDQAVRRFDSLDPSDAAYGSAGEEIQRLRAGLELLGGR